MQERVIWLNCNKGACGLIAGQSLIRYLQENQPSIACLSELKRNESQEPPPMDGYCWAFHSRNIGILIRNGVRWQLGRHFSDFFASIIVGEHEIASVYLDGTSAKRRKEQIQKLLDHAKASDFRLVFGGDFNTVTREEDSVFDGRTSAWVKPGERRLLISLLDDGKLSDPYLDAPAQGATFSFVGANQGRPYAFRSDFVLCRSNEVGRLHITYDETTRLRHGFTDHSAVIANFEGAF